MLLTLQLYALRSAQVSSEGMQALASLTELKSLSLSGTALGDEHLPVLADSPLAGTLTVLKAAKALLTVRPARGGFYLV